ncbi:MAG: thiamine phosphate synthase [Candidatus Delongbacteria bacterium]|nr:thiamine phosphate synthase [Candidatus Delongbacteria bacterium]MBN2834214.1 thiamine phosphate synthase [Candidatus Delongbacteria bacterium]
MKKVYRQIDVLINRCQEGLRVVDEIIRFWLGDIPTLTRLKTIRHNLRNVFNVSDVLLLSSRDTETDPGFKFSIKTERERKSVVDILKASFKRVIESVRVMEELGKIPYLNVSMNLEVVRKELYEIEKKVLLKFLVVLPDQSIYPITHEDFTNEFVLFLAEKFEFIQLRLKNKSVKEVVKTVEKIKLVAPNLKIIINDYIEVCILFDLLGVHLGQDDLPIEYARKLLGDGKLIGISTHTLEQAVKAEKEGADYIGFGPIFDTNTKDTGYSSRGIEMLKKVTDTVEIPVVAIGGINYNNIDLLKHTGIHSVAVINAISKKDKDEVNLFINSATQFFPCKSKKK